MWRPSKVTLTSFVIVGGLSGALSASAQEAAPPAAAPPAAAPPAEAAPPATEPTPEATPAPASEPEPVAATGDDYSYSHADQPAAYPEEEPPPKPRGPVKQVSIYLGSPIWLTKAPIDPGFGFEIRNGLKLGVLVPEFAIGFQWNWFNVNKVREQFPEFNQPQTLSGEDIAGTWLNLGLRFEPEVHAKFQPYVSLGFDAILWGFSFDRESYCGWWSCGTVRNYEFAPGFSSRIGFRYSPQPFFGLDLGVRPAMSFEGWAFEKTQVWLEPYAGITLSLDAARRR